MRRKIIKKLSYPLKLSFENPAVNHNFHNICYPLFDSCLYANATQRMDKNLISKLRRKIAPRLYQKWSRTEAREKGLVCKFSIGSRISMAVELLIKLQAAPE